MTQKPNYLSQAATKDESVKLLRAHFASLYELPINRFRALVAPAVKLGLESGDFHEPRLKAIMREYDEEY